MPWHWWQRAALISWLGRDLPDLNDIENLRLSQATYIYSADGVLLGTVMSVYRKWVPLIKIPKHLQWATIVAEDRKFYTHPGVDPKGIARAVWECVKARRYVQGGSTITMQLARNLYLLFRENHKAQTEGTVTGCSAGAEVFQRGVVGTLPEHSLLRSRRIWRSSGG
jgi:membrane carboxypeptidase/penicillin-binding protein